MKQYVQGPGILDGAREEDRAEILEMLTQAYWMEIETVMNYVAGSTNPDGLRAQEIVEALADDVQDELKHAQLFARRIKELYGIVPGSESFAATQGSLQPTEDTTDLLTLINGVIDAEDGAIAHYTRIIESCDGIDFATQDMVTEILRDEERHRRLFDGFRREFEGAAGPARKRS